MRRASFHYRKGSSRDHLPFNMLLLAVLHLSSFTARLAFCESSASSTLEYLYFVSAQILVRYTYMKILYMVLVPIYVSREIKSTPFAGQRFSKNKMFYRLQ